MDQIPASSPIPSDDRPDLRSEEAHYEQTYQTIDGDQGTYESLSHPSAQETEQRPPSRKIGFRCALALGVLLSASVLGLVAFTVYHFTAKNGSASTTASVRVCDREVWVASFNQGSGGRGVLKPQLPGPVTCRAGCEADADCVSYELSNSACHFITDSFLELRDEPGTTSYRRQRVCVWGSATCIFTYEGRYDLNDKTDSPLSREPNLESCLLRCLNAASVCNGLSYNTQAGTGECKPRHAMADLESRTKLKGYVEYTVACTGVTTTTLPTTTPTVPTTRTTQPTTTTTQPTTTPTTTTLPSTTPLTTTLSTTPCVGDPVWIRYPNQFTNGGLLQLGVTNLLACQDICLGQQETCFGVDYYTNPGSLTACWIQLIPNSVSDLRNRDGVTHYQLVSVAYCV